jgi:hypothetical protein
MCKDLSVVVEVVPVPAAVSTNQTEEVTIAIKEDICEPHLGLDQWLVMEPLLIDIVEEVVVIIVLFIVAGH